MSLKALETVKSWHMLEDGGCVVAGVSGGADSLTLLHFLCSLREVRGIRVLAAHVNHGLRGEEALRDERHVAKICNDWGVKLFIRRADVRAQARACGESEEQAGRRVRYAFFSEIACRENAKIATAHTLSDSMETVLLNLIRGTGLKGMCGIPPVRGNIIRPLIRDSRRDIEQYCLENGIRYIQDSTNFSKDYARNRVRLDVIPAFYAVNPSFEKSFRRFLSNFSQDEDFLLQMAKLKLEETRTACGEWDALALGGLEAPVVSRAVAMAAAECTGTEQEAVHIDGMRGLLAKKSGRLQLKGGWFACVSGGKLRFCPPPASYGDYEFPLSEGDYEAGGCTIRVRRVVLEQKNINNFKIILKQYFKFMIDCDKIIGNAVIRSRRPGDAFRPAGRGVSKTLKKLMNEEHVPVSSRGALPCAADGRGILWVYGFGPDERCMADENTKNAYQIEITNPEGQDFERRY